MAGESPETLRALQQRDPRILDRIVRENLPVLLRAARGAGLSQEAAEDLVQNVFMTFLEKIPTFEGRSTVRTWLFGILYRKLMESRRALGREGRMEDVDLVVESRFRPDGTWARPPRATDKRLAISELRRFLQECLEEVPVRHRMALLLRDVEGLGTEEICKIMEITRTHLGVMLFRARNRLRECLERRGVEGSQDAQV
jgi:RNA polymerase sigma-70 factor (ECF subfamily)